MKKAFLNDNFIIFLIIVNAAVLFLDSFDRIQAMVPWLDKVDILISSLFLVEMFVKINEYSWKGYIENDWNKLDFAINLFIIPCLALFFFDSPHIMVLTVVRLIRIAKFFRFFKFVPNIDRILSGIIRALKSSIFVILAMLLYLFIVSIISCAFFKSVAPEHFGDPLLSLYSIFKIFTIEGWYELPELIAAQYGDTAAFFIKIYFIFLVLSGGVCGISLVNAIFVDEMVSDNSDDLEKKIDSIQKQLEELSKKLDKKE